MTDFKNDDFKYFKLSDFDCQETGENEMDVQFIKGLDHLREVCKFPFIITSGFRSKTHSIEARKSTPGTHTQGIAADIKVSGGAQRLAIVKHLLLECLSALLKPLFMLIHERQSRCVGAINLRVINLINMIKFGEHK
jgi:hypothetical protein